MTTIPYDLVSQNPSFTLTEEDWENYLDVSSIRKRQLLSSAASLTAEQLYALCPLNDITNADVPAGCIAGIYQKFCVRAQFEDIALPICQNAYDQVFSVSIFKPIAEVCPAWKKGPQSAECASAIKDFRFQLPYILVTSAHAANLNANIFARPRYAPCRNTASVTCNW
jgi:hypothetical protein